MQTKFINKLHNYEYNNYFIIISERFNYLMLCNFRDDNIMHSRVMTYASSF